MSTLSWIIVAGLAMSALALVGAVTVALPPPVLDRILLPLARPSRSRNVTAGRPRDVPSLPEEYPWDI